jgi:hypothetical protein
MSLNISLLLFYFWKQCCPKNCRYCRITFIVVHSVLMKTYFSTYSFYPAVLCFKLLICWTFLRINELSVGNFVSSLFTKLIENCIKILPAVWFWTFYNVGTTFFSFELIVLEFQKKVRNNIFLGQIFSIFVAQVRNNEIKNTLKVK